MDFNLLHSSSSVEHVQKSYCCKRDTRGQKWNSSYSRTFNVTGTEAPFGSRVMSPENTARCLCLGPRGNNIATPTSTGDLSYEIDIRGTNKAGESSRRCIMDADSLLYLTPSSTLAVKCTHYSRVFVQVPYFDSSEVKKPSPISCRIGEEAIEGGPSG
ncbi:uncharacterized protein [Arachis hypogaea]|uniref:uncharacterized protein n=1 Tax=Arachis hypogaea TaxID=3818 RepID=UPI003B2289A9